MFSLAGKTAIVTGAGQGIGQGIAQVFAEAGARVYMCGLETDMGDEAAAEINEGGGQAVYRRVDIGDEIAARDFVKLAADETGRVDVLCNNAAYTKGPQHDILNAPAEEWDKNIRVALMGTLYCTRAALPYMIEAGGGSVIVISSVMGMTASAESTPYSTVKAGQFGFVRSAACDYGKHNIRVNAICPGPIRVRYSPEPGSPGHERQIEKTMLGRVGQPREIGYAALLLASEEGSFITGTVIPVDGGWTAM